MPGTTPPIATDELYVDCVTQLMTTNGQGPLPALAEPQRDDRLDALIDLSLAIGTIRDTRQLMSEIMRHVTRLLDAERCLVYLHDPRSHELQTLAPGHTHDRPSDHRLHDDRGLCGRCFKTRQPIRMADVQADRHIARELATEMCDLPHSMLVVPIMFGDARCLGVIQAMDRRADYFTEENLALLEAIAAQIAVSLENVRLHQAQRRQFNGVVRAFSAALDARDPLTAIHSVNVANYAMGIGQILDLPPAEIEYLRIAGLLHDIGKIGVPEAVLIKPGRLTPAEFDEMKLHARYSGEILAQIEFAEELTGLDVDAAAHHERLDGSGYPDGVRGDRLSLKARILAVADIYDALTQTRHYRRSMSMHEALRTIDELTPHQLDRRCVGALKAFLGCGPWPLPEDA